MAVPEVKVRISATDVSRSVLSSVQRNVESLRGQFVEGGAAAVRAATGTGRWELGLQKLSIQQAQSTNYTSRWTAGLRALQVQQVATTAATVAGAGAVATRGVEGYKKFGNAVTNIGFRMIGVSGQAGKFAEGLLLMGLGGPVTLAVAGGLAILGAGYMLLTKRTREAKKAQEELNEEYDKFIEMQNPVLKHTAAATVFAQQAMAIEKQIEKLRAANGGEIVTLGARGGAPIRTKIDNTKEITRLEAERTKVLERLTAAESEANKAFNEGLPPKGRKPPKAPKPEIFDNTAPHGDGNTVAAGGLGIAGSVAGTILGGSRGPKGPNANGKSPLREALEAEVAAVLARARELREELTAGIADALGDGIANGIATAISRGGIGAGFKALTQTLLAGIGQAMVHFGKAGLAASTLMLKIKLALSTLNPAAGIAASIAMIAVGAALSGAASSMFGGSSSSGYSARGLSDTVTRVTVSSPSPSQSTASMTAQRPIVYAPVHIGKHDQTAQRELVEMLNLAAGRGHKVKS